MCNLISVPTPGGAETPKKPGASLRPSEEVAAVHKDPENELYREDRAERGLDDLARGFPGPIKGLLIGRFVFLPIFHRRVLYF